jgi:hypothetical protein
MAAFGSCESDIGQPVSRLGCMKTKRACGSAPHSARAKEATYARIEQMFGEIEGAAHRYLRLSR